MTQETQRGAYASRTADKFVVRLPDGMRTRVKDAAEASNRSMNMEIVNRLEMSLQGNDDPHMVRALKTRNFILEKHLESMPPDLTGPDFLAWAQKSADLASGVAAM